MTFTWKQYKGRQKSPLFEQKSVKKTSMETVIALMVKKSKKRLKLIRVD